MPNDRHSSCPGDNPGRPIDELKYRFEDQAVLTLSRHYFSSFAAPQSQAWLGALRVSNDLFGREHGPNVAVSVLEAVQAMRSIRKSCFIFNSPQCQCCASFVTSHEQSFMSTLRAMKRGDLDTAGAHASLLCELGDVSGLLQAFIALVDVLYRADPTCINHHHLAETADSPPPWAFY